MIDIQLIRNEDTRDLVRRSEQDRFRDPTIVDKVLQADTEWREVNHKRSGLARITNTASRTIGKKKKAGQITDGETDDITEICDEGTITDMTIETIEGMTVAQLMQFVSWVNDFKSKLEEREKHLVAARTEYLKMIGNILDPTVPVFESEDHNDLIHTYHSHNDIDLRASDLSTHDILLQRIGALNMKTGSEVAGNRGYYLIGPGVYLAQALTQLSLAILGDKGYVPVQPPYFMNYKMLDRTAQLGNFDDLQYRVVKGYDDSNGESDHDMYLIATSEQPLTALNHDKKFSHKMLPIRYAGISPCFRTETGRHGVDTHGIFRVHQFEKIEQFVLCSPEPGSPENSGTMMEEMMGNCRKFLELLNVSYRVVSIVSKELNLSAAIKYDIEGLFVSKESESGTKYRELVSCSNCTDYQARSTNTQYESREHRYVHMLNSTMCAVTRMICAVVESNQTKDGIIVPAALRQYMPKQYSELIPYVM